MSILLVDDSRTQLANLETMLHGEGYDSVLTATSILEALELLNSPAQIDLILLDILMPKIDGIEGCRLIKRNQLFAHLPIIMVSTVTEVDSLKAAFEAGAVDYITKPPSQVEVGARVGSALRLKKEMDRCLARESELQTALEQVKTLSGLLPICANCKKVRNDQGYWSQIEDFIQQHSSANFTHSICPQCAKKLYPELYEQPS